jgi:predicted DNA-binding ribbon-helix-helix protein
MKSTVTKRSIILAGHKTSISLEDEFWDGIRQIASAKNMTITGLVNQIDSGRQGGSLSSALRLFVLRNYRDQPR